MSVSLIVTVVLAVCGLMVFGVYPKTSHPVKNALFGMCSGGLGLLAINLSSVFTGITVACNLYTGAVSLILGLPGVVFLLILRLLVG